MMQSGHEVCYHRCATFPHQNTTHAKAHDNVKPTRSIRLARTTIAARTTTAAWMTIAALLTMPGGLHGQLRPLEPSPGSPITIPRLAGEIELDGIVDEAAWDEVAPYAMTMYTPTCQAPLTEETEVRIAHDDRYLYVSGRMYDSDPSQVRTGTFYRDQYSGDDILAVVIDSYND